MTIQRSLDPSDPVHPRIADYIQSLAPYIPGKPIEETQREYQIENVVKLASNENSLGPSPQALQAIQHHLLDLHRYPDASAYRLKNSLAEHLNVDPSSLMIGNGSNEIIDQIVRTYCVPGDAIATTQAAFIAYKICAQIHGVRTLEVALKDNMKWDIQELVDRVQEDERVRVVFLANPNNPTGSYLNFGEIRDIMEGLSRIRGGSVVLALDYAYWEYVTAKDLPEPTQLMNFYPHLILLRTFSKIYGLSGLRVGYAMAAPSLISQLEKVRQPFNVNSLALAGAVAALKDVKFVMRSRKENESAMQFWEKTLTQIGIPFWRSQGNFILADVQTGLGKSGVEVYEYCLKQGVIFRPVANYGLPNALRISMGVAQENEIAAGVLNSKELKSSITRGAKPWSKK